MDIRLPRVLMVSPIQSTVKSWLRARLRYPVICAT